MAESEPKIDDLADVPDHWKNATARGLLGPHPSVEEDPQEKAYRLRVIAAREAALKATRDTMEEQG